jgi:hypothetical protein
MDDDVPARHGWQSAGSKVVIIRIHRVFVLNYELQTSGKL